MMIGWEAQLWLRHCLEGGILEDPAVDYLAERVDEMDAAALLEAMGLIRKRLAEIEVLEGTDDGERIRVTKDFRILLPDRFDTEIRLRPLVKTVFLLFEWSSAVMTSHSSSGSKMQRSACAPTLIAASGRPNILRGLTDISSAILERLSLPVW
jgi:hypothetical protein